MRPPFPHVALALGLIVGSSQAPAVTDSAQSALRQARAAIGGEDRLQAVRSLSVKGLARLGPDPNQITFTSLQIDILLPDRFLISRERPFFNRQGGFNGRELIERRQMDGAWTELRPANVESAEYAWQIAARRRECARYLVAWLLSAPPEYSVQWFGPSDTTDPNTDAIDVKGANDLALRLHFDRTTHRLAKLTYDDLVPTGTTAASANAPLAGVTGPPVFTRLDDPNAKTPQITVTFTDHHVDDGILFPHKVTIESGGEPEVWQISRFRVNPPLTPKDFERK